MFLFLIGLAIYVLGLVAFTLRGLVNPPRRTYASAVSRGRPGDPGEIAPEHGGPMTFRAWEFTSRGIRLNAWDIVGDDPHGPCFILTHGWGDSCIGSISRVSALRALGSRFIAWDMRGHGVSSGSSTLGILEHEDLRALLDSIGTRQPLVLFGWSLGAGVSIELAGREPDGIIAVIAESPYRFPQTPAKNMLTSMGMPSGPNLSAALGILSLRHARRFHTRHSEPFDRAFWSARLKCPLLVLHGESDMISPLEDAGVIAASSPGSTLEILKDGRHDGLWTDRQTRAQSTLAVKNLISGLGRCTASTIQG